MVDELNIGLMPPGARAVAYFRCSVDSGDRRALMMQQDRVRRWAIADGVEIIREFCDVRPVGAGSEDCPAFVEMVNDWITRRNDFDCVLCFDLSRVGRVEDDEHASFAAICEQHGKRIVVAGAA